jgi:hypothetical protein
MVIVKCSPNMVADLFTPCVVKPHECVKGIPMGSTLIDVEYKDDMVIYYFDDGKNQLEERVIEFKMVEKKN